MKFKNLIKTTEGAVVLGGLFLIVISPIFGPKIWALLTAIAYILVNIPELLVDIKEWYKNLKSGSKD